MMFFGLAFRKQPMQMIGEMQSRLIEHPGKAIA